MSGRFLILGEATLCVSVRWLLFPLWVLLKQRELG